MIRKDKLKVVVGLGKTGLSCVRYLKKHNINVAVVDSRVNPPGLIELKQTFPNVPVFFGSLDAEILAQADELIVSPGVALQEPAIAKQIERGISVIGDIELFARVATAPIVAITGSNGKSTVTVLVGEMAKTAGLDVRVGGNLGTPALELLQDHEPDLYVLELSSFQLETTFSLHAAAAVVLNISPDHMDRYENITEYQAAKMRIYEGCNVAVLNKDSLNNRQHNKALIFGLGEPQANEFGVKDNYLMHGSQKLLAVSELKIKGDHQIANALAALALGTAAQLPMSAMLAALCKFTGLSHRCQWIGKFAGIEWYNDSKATNVGAALAAITGLAPYVVGKLILIAGGQGKDADFSVLYSAVREHVRMVILLGEDADKLAAALDRAAEIICTQSMQEAVECAAQNAQSGDVVLLSPACASFDMFANFEQRGEVFTENVKTLYLHL